MGDPMTSLRRHRTRIPLLALIAIAGGAAVLAADAVSPLRIDAPLGPSGPKLARFSERTLALALEIDRHSARVVSYTIKPRPYVGPPAPFEPRSYSQAGKIQLEVVLRGPAGLEHTRRIDVGPLCFDHGPTAEPHVAGDTVLLHRDTFRVDLPEIADFDQVDLGYYTKYRGGLERRDLGVSKLTSSAFAAAPATSGAVLWPEDFGDTQVYEVFGDPAEGDRRINIVIVPDGYTYAEKDQMRQHAAALVDGFRAKTPYAEHDPFINYTLVYAYSTESGTDQCDCGVVVDTAMGTRFPDAGYPCGDSGNRCLYYGGGCDTSGTTNIVAAELRAPFHDESIVMVNTARYGGCGGARAVYSAGNASATEVAVHELGHSLGGLADEYAYTAGCGGWAGEVNTSLDGLRGAWPEWIGDIGAPLEGAQYYQQCIYRPTANCEMRSLSQPFCPVCNQHWSLITFGHPRVSPSAPVATRTPAADPTVFSSVPVDFAVGTRLSIGPDVTNSLTWTIEGPGYPAPTTLTTGTTALSHTFDQPGVHTVTCEVVADTNFVKPSRNAANVDSVSWTVTVELLAPPPEVSPPGSAEPLEFADRETLVWSDASLDGAVYYNLYRGDLSSLHTTQYGVCLASDLGGNSVGGIEDPPPGGRWFFLVTGTNPAGEGPLGNTADGTPRPNLTPCP